MDLEHARQQMIEQQVRAWEVLDRRVLDVLAAVPREEFVPDPYRLLAFADTEIPLNHGQVMMRPSVEGRMLQALGVRPGDDALEIGTGSGYTAACLAGLGAEVLSIDLYADFATHARATNQRLAIGGVTLETGDAGRLETSNKYDVIACTGSLPAYEPSYAEALRVGGRLFVIVGTPPAMEALLVTRLERDQWARESLFETVVRPLENVTQPEPFVF